MYPRCGSDTYRYRVLVEPSAYIYTCVCVGGEGACEILAEQIIHDKNTTVFINHIMYECIMKNTMWIHLRSRVSHNSFNSLSSIKVMQQFGETLQPKIFFPRFISVITCVGFEYLTHVVYYFLYTFTHDVFWNICGILNIFRIH